MARRRGRHRARKQRCGRRLADLAPRLGHALGGGWRCSRAPGAVLPPDREAGRLAPRAQRAAPRLQGARPGRGGGVLAPAPPLRSPLHRGGGGRRSSPARQTNYAPICAACSPMGAGDLELNALFQRGRRLQAAQAAQAEAQGAQGTGEEPPAWRLRSEGAPSGARRTALLGRRRGAGPGLLLRLARLFFCRRGLACWRRARSDRHAHRLAAPLS